MSDAVEKYIANLERKGNKPGSVKTARYRLAAILELDKPLHHLMPTRGQALYDDLVDAKDDKGRPLHSVDTHRGCLISAKAFGRFCVDRGWLRLNPFGKVEPVGRRSRGKGQMRIDEARRFLEHCLAEWEVKRDRSAIAAVLPLLLNLRASEVAQLTARDVDDEGRLLWIADADAKTESSRRRSLVPDILVGPLRELAAAPATPEGALFVLASGKRRGQRVDRYWVSHHAERLMRAAGLPVVTLHGLRGTHATLATDAGATADTVAGAMGHSSSAVTSAHYIDADVAADARTRRAIGTLTRGSGKREL